MRARLVALFAATAVIIAGSYVVRDATGASVARRDAVIHSGPGVAALSAGPAEWDGPEVDRLIRAFEHQVHERPNATGLTFLGQLYLQKARLTGDVANFLQAQAALDAALARYPADPEARGLMANLRYTTHDFSGALLLAQQILAADPTQYGALATQGDAKAELGDYPGAAEAYARLATASPGTAAVDARRARLAFLTGRTDDARVLAATAADEAREAGLFGASLAFYLMAPGQVAFDAGHYGEAIRWYRRALAATPGYYLAQAGLAKSLAATGDTRGAIRLYEKAIATVPQPDLVAALGDLYTLRHDPRRAARQYATVEVIATLARINQQVYNRQLAVFYADHHLRPDEAVRLAGAELAVRKDVFGSDAYAWTLVRAGRPSEARAASDRALALGTPDAKLWYHAGMISKALGDVRRARTELARSLEISPAFDPLQSRRARAALEALGR